MIKFIKNILLLSAVLMAAVGCSRDSIVNTVDAQITLTATEAGATKAILNANTFATIGNRVQIFDYFTPGPSGSPVEGYYIDNDVAQSGGAYTWPFVNESYKWTVDGVHKFWGWLETDSNISMTAASFFGSGFEFNKGAQQLSIPAIEMDQSSTQFDFMYSGIYKRDLTEPDYSAIPLKFYHLFTAFSIAVKDVAEYNEYLIESIQVKGMKTTCSATVDFSGDETVVTYEGSANSDAAFSFAPATSFQLTTDLTDVATWEEVEDGREYFLAWPQDARTVSIVITYKAKEVNDAAYTSYTKTILLPFALEAGKKHNLNLEFKDKEITLDYYIEDWITVTEEIDFSDQVTVDEETGTIKWVDGVQEVDYVKGEVILFDDPKIEATCTFTILTPKGATWTASLISKEGHPDAFRFVEGTKYGTVGDESTIKLVVTNQDPISPRHVAELLITVQTADGRTIVVDDALTPEEYEGQPTEYTRFKIIQNLIN